MSRAAILHEVQLLHGVSDSLEMLAEQTPVVLQALLSISGSVRNSATLLEVVVATKLTPFPESGPASD